MPADTTGTTSKQHAGRFAEVIVIGAGFAGIGSAIRLKEAGFDFLVLEKSTEIGGVWRDNVYPDCACDIPSALYSYSFAPKPDWSGFYAKQGEILQYTRHTVKQYQLEQHILLQHELVNAHWEQGDNCWRLETSAGTYRCRYVITACGPMHVPVIPDIDGIDDFAGDVFHSARWQTDYDFEHKRVAVIGSGASAIQFVPAIQPDVSKLVLFQRTPPWVLPKMDVPIPGKWQRRFARFPILQRVLRSALYLQFEILNRGLNWPWFVKRLQGLAKGNIYKSIKDPELRQTLVPDYTIGCKRILQSNTWYSALAHDNVTVTADIKRIEGNTLIASNGTRHEVDAIIFATGFEVANPPIAERITGVSGQSLADRWAGSPAVYMGTLAEDCPNLFLTFGANLYTFSSAFVIIEAQLKLIMNVLNEAREKRVAWFSIRSEYNRSYNGEVQSALAKTVWNRGGCSSYFIDKNGRNSSNWPWTTFTMRRRFGNFGLTERALETQPEN